MRARIAAVAAALLLLTPVPAEAAAPPTGCGFQNLDPLPLIGATTAGSALDRDRVYSVTSSASGPAILGIRNARDGSLIAERPLPAALGSWAVTVAPDHSVYVGSYNSTPGAMGRLFRYTPADDKVTELGIPISTDTYVWTVAATKDAVYGGTSSSGKLFRYDVATGEIKDLGSPVPGEQFIRDLAIGEDGTIFAGMGQASMKVAVLSPGGELQRIIEPPLQGVGWSYDVDVVGRYLLVRYLTTTGTNPMGIYDLARDEWKHVVEDVDSLTLGGGALGNKVYLVQDGELAVLDLKTGKTRALGYTDFGDGAIRPLGWLGHTLVGTTGAGRIWHYNRKTGVGKLFDSTVTGQRVSIRSMTTGPDGHIYGSGFFTGGLASFDPATGEKKFWPNTGQSEGMLTHKGKLYLGVYPGARIYAWNGTAPELLLSLSDQEQDRPFAMASAGDWLAFGTVPKSGASGGVLGLLNPETGETRIRRNLIPGHSIIGLAYRDGILYGATTTFGGVGYPLDTAAKVFAYDIATDTVKWVTAPVEGDLALGSITFDDEGKLWGLTPDALYVIDPATGQTLRTAKHQTYPWATQTQVWLDTYIEFHNGYLWGKAQKRAYRIDPATMKMTRITSADIGILIKGPEGHMYLSRFENFYTYRIC
ncbi:hypothetical protein [Nonomuraea zeae]|uniref:PQQ-like beta-propeller repeat protein n=1 Tax=Nonomuraea zeae TaxID=1642303 RepID=A0A5S4FK41_9ACTN|nr:hypothetical protein [Nonomuraea zeae]TMR20995.1 hypothetical protein ETD85_51510 [Nonomuraea zeae]